MKQGKRSEPFARQLAGALRQHFRRALLVVLAALVAVPVGGDAALAWRRTMMPEVQPAPKADAYQRLRWMAGSYTELEQIRAHSAEIRQASRELLAASPLHAMAMRQLAVTAALEREGGGEKELALAERISRRDLPTQLALINVSALNDDMDATLTHYDRALTVNPEARSQLLPVLTQAVADSDVRSGLVAFAGRPWFAEFLGFAASSEADPIPQAALLLALRGKLPASSIEGPASRLLSRLVNGGEYGQARELLRVFADARPEALDTIGFSAATADPRLAPLTWSIVNESAAEAEVSNGMLVVRIAAERSAVVAERTTLLTPGRYTLMQQIRNEPDAPPARLKWMVSCREGAKSQIMEAAVPATEGQAARDLSLTVPAGCRAQQWQLSAEAGTSQSDAMAAIGLVLAKE